MTRRAEKSNRPGNGCLAARFEDALQSGGNSQSARRRGGHTASVSALLLIASPSCPRSGRSAITSGSARPPVNWASPRACGTGEPTARSTSQPRSVRPSTATRACANPANPPTAGLADDQRRRDHQASARAGPGSPPVADDARSATGPRRRGEDCRIHRHRWQSDDIDETAGHRPLRRPALSWWRPWIVDLAGAQIGRFWVMNDGTVRGERGR
jgi:hypothetical protein